MFYVVLSVGKDPNYETCVLGIYTNEQAAQTALEAAEEEIEKQQCSDWHSHRAEIAQVPALNVRGKTNYDWSSFSQEPPIDWGEATDDEGLQ